MSVEHIVILILVCALAAKFIFFEDQEELDTKLILATKKVESETREENMNNLTKESSMKHVASLADLRLSIEPKVKPKRPIFELSDFESEDKETQTEVSTVPTLTASEKKISIDNIPRFPRAEAECLEIYKSELGAQGLSDNEVILLVNKGHIPLYKLEGALGDNLRGVKLRREIITQRSGFQPDVLDGLPYLHYDYSKVNVTN